MKETATSDNATSIKKAVNFIKSINIPALKEQVKTFYTQTKSDFEEIKSRAKDLKKSNYDLALYHYSKGNTFDTRFRFWIYNRFWKDAPESSYFIGRSYLEEKNFAKAKPHLEQYMQCADTKFKAEADFSLKLINDEDVVKIPEIIEKHNHTNLLRNLQKDLTAENPAAVSYQEFSQFIVSEITATEKPLGNKTLDLGAGFGFVSNILKAEKISTNITTYEDVKECVKVLEMQKVKDLKTFDKIIEMDFSQDLSQVELVQYHLIIIADLLNYDNDMAKFASYIKPRLSEKGLVAIMFNATDKDKVVVNKYDESFAYPLKAVKDIFKQVGLETFKEKILSDTNKVLIMFQ